MGLRLWLVLQILCVLLKVLTYYNNLMVYSQMRINIIAFIVLVLSLTPMVVQAQLTSNTVPQFLPTAGWTVKPSITGDTSRFGDLKLPCMMMVEYDNGYIMRLSGGAGKLMAMAVDFRQDAFAQGRKYKAAITLDGVSFGSIDATAFSKNALIINTRPINSFYQSLSNAKQMSMEIEGNKFQFTLGDIAQAFNRLEGCYNGDKEMTTASLSQPLGAAKEPKSTSDVRDNGITWKNSRETLAKSSPVTMPKAQPRRQKPAQIWRAREGDSLKSTLTRWAEQADVEIDWQASMTGNVMSDMALTTGFEEAVQTLIAQSAAANGIQADLRGDTTKMRNASYNQQGVSKMPTALKPVMREPVSLAPQSRISPMARSNGSMSQPRAAKWRIGQGSDLRSALEAWSKQAGVELFWDANQQFIVRQSIANNGSYESALEALLGQFANDSVRPLAQLNNDPVSGRRILIVQSSRVL